MAKNVLTDFIYLSMSSLSQKQMFVIFVGNSRNSQVLFQILFVFHQMSVIYESFIHLVEAAQYEYHTAKSDKRTNQKRKKANETHTHTHHRTILRLRPDLTK